MSSDYHICYHVTLDHLIEHYVSLNYYMDAVVCIHNPSEYQDYLKDIGLYFEKYDAMFDQVMVVVVEELATGLKILKSLNPSEGPFASLWLKGEKISDNIEEELRFGA